MKLATIKFCIELYYFSEGTIVRIGEVMAKHSKGASSQRSPHKRVTKLLHHFRQAKPQRTRTLAVSSILQCRSLPKCAKFSRPTKCWFLRKWLQRSTSSSPAVQYTISIYLLPFLFITNISKDNRRS